MILTSVYPLYFLDGQKSTTDASTNSNREINNKGSKSHYAHNDRKRETGQLENTGTKKARMEDNATPKVLGEIDDESKEGQLENSGMKKAGIEEIATKESKEVQLENIDKEGVTILNVMKWAGHIELAKSKIRKTIECTIPGGPL